MPTKKLFSPLIRKSIQKQIYYPADEGYIFYNNMSRRDLPGYDNLHWTSVYAGARSYFSKVDIPAARDESAVSYLRKMAAVELKKERKYLEDVLGGRVDWNIATYGEILKSLNQLLTLAPIVRRVVERLDEGENAANRGITAASFFGSKLSTALEKEVSNFVAELSTDSKKVITMSSEEFTKILDAHLLRAIDTALENTLLAKYSNKKNEERQIWKDALAQIEKLENFSTNLLKSVSAIAGLDDLTKEIKEIVLNTEEMTIEKFRADVLKSVRTQVKQKLSISQVAGHLGGLVAQQLGQLFSLAGGGAKGTLEIGKYKSTTDVVYQEGLSIPMPDFENTLMNSKNKQETRQRLKTLYTEQLSKIEKGNIIYENTKNYQLGKHFRGFHGGEQKLDYIEDILGEIGYDKGKRFINLVKQTIPGALLSETDARERASNYLAQAVAYLLFDDVDTIGKEAGGGLNVIHIFRLTDVVVPLSFLLNQLADAMELSQKDANRFVKVRFNLPSAVKYDYPQPDKSPTASAMRWETQREAASEATVTLKFLSNFKDILREFFSHI